MRIDSPITSTDGPVETRIRGSRTAAKSENSRLPTSCRDCRSHDADSPRRQGTINERCLYSASTICCRNASHACVDYPQEWTFY